MFSLPIRYFNLCFVLLGLLLFMSGNCLAAGTPIIIDYACSEQSGFPDTDRHVTWQTEPSGQFLVLPGKRCWVKIGSLESHQSGDTFDSVTIHNAKSNLQFYDRGGNLIARAFRTGVIENAMLVGNVVNLPRQIIHSFPIYISIDLIPDTIYPTFVLFTQENMTNSANSADHALAFDWMAASLFASLAIFTICMGAALRRPDPVLVGVWALGWAAYYVVYHGAISVFGYSPFLVMIHSYSNFANGFLLALLATRAGHFKVHCPRIHQTLLVFATLFPLLAIVTRLSDAATRPELLSDCELLLAPASMIAIAGAWAGIKRKDQACVLLLVALLPVTIGDAISLLAGFIQGKLNYLVPAFFAPGSAFEFFQSIWVPFIFFLSLVYRSHQLRDNALRLALHDPLTGLPNREKLRRHGENLLARGIQLTAVVLDLERFKLVNTALGRALGDRVLQQIATRLTQLDVAIVGRLHADRFALLFEKPEQLDHLHEHINALFREPIEIDGQLVDLSAKAGVAIEQGKSTIEDLMRNAEVALNAARTQHKPWMQYRPEFETVRLADLSLLSDLNRAIENGELRLYLQPKVHLHDGVTRCCEALIRWQHPERGMIPPGDFIPFVEQTGRIGLLTRWMLTEAMKVTVAMREQGTPLQISVNVSTVDLSEPGLDHDIVALAHAIDAKPADIRLEVTESGVMNEPGLALDVMQRVYKAGFSWSIDDFGTGYSSLAYLQKMPVAELKIDRAFVRGVLPGTDAATLLACTLDLGHRLGLKIVAEGAEIASEWAMLRDLGCDMAQGWFAAKPMPVEQFMVWQAENPHFGVNIEYEGNANGIPQST